MKDEISELKKIVTYQLEILANLMWECASKLSAELHYDDNIDELTSKLYDINDTVLYNYSIYQDYELKIKTYPYLNSEQKKKNLSQFRFDAEDNYRLLSKNIILYFGHIEKGQKLKYYSLFEFINYAKQKINDGDRIIGELSRLNHEINKTIIAKNVEKN